MNKQNDTMRKEYDYISLIEFIRNDTFGKDIDVVERFLLYKLLDKCKEHEVDVYIQNTEERWREFLLLKNNAGGIPVIKSVEIGENDYGSIYDDMNNAMVLIDKYFVRNKRTRKLFGYGIMNTIKKIIKKVKNFFKKNDRTKK